MKIFKFLLLAVGLWGLAGSAHAHTLTRPLVHPMGVDTIPVTKKGIVPPRNLRNWDYDKADAIYGSMLGIRKYPASSGCDTCVGFLPIYYLGDSVMMIGGLTVITSGNIGTFAPGTDLTYTASTRTLNSSTGADVVLPLFTSTEAGLVPLSGGGTINFLRADGAWSAPAGSVTSVAMTVPTGLTVSGSPITTSGTLAVSNNMAAGVVHSAGVGGALSTSAVLLTSEVSGTLPIANGGTNLTTYTTGDLIYASATNTLSKLADVATGNALISGGVGVAPSWGKIGLTTHVSGTLPIANGGTNLTTYTTGDLIYASATNTLSKLAAGTNGHVLTLAAGVPTWAASGGGSPAGSNTQVQFNNSGAFGANSKFTYVSSTGKLGLSGIENGGSRGSGAAPILQILDLAGNDVFNFYSGSEMTIGSQSSFQRRMFLSSEDVYFNNSAPTAGFFFQAGTDSGTTGTKVNATFGGNTFNPSSGSKNYTIGQFRATINQTGSATGNVIALQINPTLVSVTGDFTALDIPITSNKAIWQSGTAAINAFAGNSKFGATTTPSEKIDVAGNILLSGVLKNADGTAAAPSYTFTNGTTTGLWRPTTSVIGVALGGAEYARFTTTGLNLGVAGASLGAVKISGNTSGTVTVTTAAAAGTWTLTLPTTAGTSGQVLQTNGSGVTSWATAGGLSGSGTSGQVAYWNGTSSLTSNSSFTYDGTSVTVANVLKVADGTAAAPGVAFSGDTDSGIYRYGPNELGIATAGGAQVIVDYVGLRVGTATASSRLHVTGNLSAAAWTTNGIGFRMDAATYTNTTSTGTSAAQYAHVIGVPTYAASSSSIYTTTATVYIAGAPVSGTNVSDGSFVYALYANGGIRGTDVTASASLRNMTNNFGVTGTLAGGSEVGVIKVNTSDQVEIGNGSSHTYIRTLLKLEGMTATNASALTPADGMLIYVTTTNGTFTSVGFWARENGAWAKL